MRFSPVVFLLLLAGGLYYLSQVDRKGALALTVVELEGQLGLPLFAPVLVLALLFGAIAVVGGKPQADSSASRVRSRPATGPARRGPVKLGKDWREVVEQQVAEAVFEDGAELLQTGKGQVPYVLRLTRLPPERARRAIGAYAQLIAGIPTPPRARVEFRDVSDEGAPRHHLIAGAFSGYFERRDFRCIRAGDDVDVLFSSPDKRWLG